MVEEKDDASTRNEVVVVLLAPWGRRGRIREAICLCVRGVRSERRSASDAVVVPVGCDIGK